MNAVKKILILIIISAVIIPLACSSQLLAWISPHDTNPANIFESASIQLAKLANQFNKNNTINITPLKPAEQESPQNITSIQNFKQPEKPYRVLIMGDSFAAVAGGFGDILEQKLVIMNDINVLRRGKVSSGLSRPDYFDWQTESTNLIQEFQPNVAIIMMGANDAQSLEVYQNGNKKYLKYGTPEWDAEYSQRVKLFLARLINNNIKVYWVGLPAMKNAEYAKKIHHINELVEAVVKENPYATYLSAEKLLANQDGTSYSAFLPDEKGVMHATRIDDGIHLTFFSGTILVNKIIDILDQDLNIKN